MEKKQTNTNNIERRTLTAEVRMTGEGESQKVIGYAAKYGLESSPMYDFRTGEMFVEVIEPGFFESVINDQDTRALLNHDQNFVLARNTKTMTITSDNIGLRYEFAPPNTTTGNDLKENLRLGNIDQSSFAFSIADKTGEEWRSVENRTDGVKYVRTLKRGGAAKLYDVSPVTFPAYPDASVALRSLNNFKSENETPEPTKPNFELKRKKIEILRMRH